MGGRNRQKKEGMTWVSVSFDKSYLTTCSWSFGPNGNVQTFLHYELFEDRDGGLFTCVCVCFPVFNTVPGVMQVLTRYLEN